MMQRFGDFLEAKSHFLMAVFIAIQSLLFLGFTVIFFIESQDSDIKYCCYICGSILVFLIFMIHFAHHSIKRAYFLELISFLIMSVISSALFMFAFYTVVVSTSQFYKIYGITATVLLSIGNILYFITAYFSYHHFQFVFFEKLGAKASLHAIFRWIQFNNSMMKLDFGLVLIFLLTVYIYNTAYIYFLVLDTLMTIIIFLLTILIRRGIRGENKQKTLIGLLTRLVLEVYKIYRVYFFLILNMEIQTKEEQYNEIKCVIILVVMSILDEVILILVVFSTIKCIYNFSKGFKEILVRQIEMNTSGTGNISDEV